MSTCDKLTGTLTLGATMSGGLLVSKGEKGDKGDKGDAYVITDADKQEIKEALSADIRELKGDLVQLYNVYVTEQNGYLNENGTYSGTTIYKSKTTKLLPSSENITYKYKGRAEGQAVSAVFYDNNKTIIGYDRKNSWWEFTNITTPINTAYVAFSSFSEESNNIIFELIVPNGYGGIVSDNSNSIRKLNEDTQDASDRIDTLTSNIGELSKRFKDITSLVYENATNYYINRNTGNLTADSSSKTTDFIEVSSGDKFKITGFANFSTCGYALYSNSKSFVSSGAHNSGTAYQFTDLEITIPENVSYIRFCSFNTATRAYGVKKYITVSISETLSILPKSRLQDKFISLDGDSVCYGVGYRGGYGKIIADRHSMAYENKAVGGGTLAHGTTDSSGNNRHWIVDSVPTLSTNSDYYIIEGGVNDYNNNVPLGVLVDGYDVSVCDNNTVLGALEIICHQLVVGFMGKKVGFLFIHNFWKHDTDWVTLWKPKMKKVLEKWGVPYLDLGEQIPSLYFVDDTLKSTYTDNGDGLHPNELGYKTFYCDKIESWLETL